MEKLKDKVALFIGGGSAVATVALRHFMKEGAKVVQVDVSDEYFKRSEDIREKYPDRVRTLVASCTEPEDMVKAAAYCKEQFGGLDILCYYAGFHGGGNIVTCPRNLWDIALEVNCFGFYNAVKAVQPYMAAQHYGKIMNFASIGGRANRGVAITYATTKAGTIGLTRALAMELAKDGITVNSMAPASLDTSEFERIAEKDSVPMQRPPQPPQGAGGPRPGAAGPGATRGGSFIPDRPVATLDEIAHVIVFMCSDDSAFLTGDCLDINGGQYMQP